MSKISATIIAYNEEAKIGDCIDSLYGIADEIVVVDSFSTDKTVEICRERGCIVTQRKMTGYGAQRQYATSLASYNYVLSIDADEVLSPELRSSILVLKNKGFEHRGYSFSRLNFYCGVPVRHCGWYPDEQVRLFDKRYANWNLHDVAERVIFRDNVLPVHLSGDILHYRCATPDEFRDTEHRHASIAAGIIAEHKRSVGALRSRLHGVRNFLHCFIVQAGALDGKAGRDICVARYRSTVTELSGGLNV